MVIKITKPTQVKIIGIALLPGEGAAVDSGRKTTVVALTFKIGVDSFKNPVFQY